ncbi:ABC transporter substrate-binding protein [Frankia sp. CNm7]|uniref:ABC transporter substrate-binding protein n=1 Tax=Frankia nepalensis TaxID=1836974 RepID=A0A937UUZ0_9ACTN|nr:ABC transporter substrate-binding protein [Frankia nepalensis]MBL7500234.1 ABC transporter substrate-binding protein [Frankia nepalensis]MBL7514272.1 ABC transporter substrate-binding protein [Frankia nepalensis]MBL7523763.1 ABC transporter substrate-binding protein [Frankia nepalensis]MBL7631696.1 ABC transporter substrate-binding protein [Frankia nepalensis]
MAVGHQAKPIKLGVLQDFTIPPGRAYDTRQDFLDALALVFREAQESGLLDRPVELVERDADGLPTGSVKSVIDSYGELVDEGCLAVFGPHISENTLALRPEIERRFRVPSISVCGADQWLGKWTFALPNGSMTDEPIILANLAARAGARTAGVLVERSVIGQLYGRGFRDACREQGLRIVAEETIAQTGQDIGDAVRSLHGSRPDALVHLGFGYGVIRINEALGALGWDPPRYMGTAFEDAYFSDEIWDAYVGWVGLEQYDEDNLVGQRFLDRFEAAYGRRPQYYAPGLCHDAGVALARAFAGAEPLSPRGVRDALERVKLVPAASGAPGTTISFGQWTRRGWMGSSYLVARAFEPDRKSHRLVARFEPS